MIEYSFLLVSFVAGFLTVLAPCILPLLPVVIVGSLASDSKVKRNPYIIILSLLISIIAFTLIIKFASSFFYIPNEYLTYTASFLIFFVGLTFLFPSIWSKIPFVSKLSISSNKALGAGTRKSGHLGDIAIGLSLGPVFSSCSPTYFVILATVLPANFFVGLIYLTAFVVGLGIVLLFIVLLGQTAIEKLVKLSDGNGIFKRSIGILMIVIAIAIFSGFDKKFGTLLLDSGFVDITQFELRSE